MIIPKVVTTLTFEYPEDDHSDYLYNDTFADYMYDHDRWESKINNVFTPFIQNNRDVNNHQVIDDEDAVIVYLNVNHSSDLIERITNMYNNLVKEALDEIQIEYNKLKQEDDKLLDEYWTTKPEPKQTLPDKPNHWEVPTKSIKEDEWNIW